MKIEITFNGGFFNVPFRGDIFRAKGIQRKFDKGREFFLAKAVSADAAFIIERVGDTFSTFKKGNSYMIGRIFSKIDTDMSPID